VQRTKLQTVPLHLWRLTRESRQAPEWIQHLLELAGGKNFFCEPMYRAIWGWNRLELIGGKWTDFDPITGCVMRERFEMRRIPKYGPPLFNENRWYIERYYPPEHFGSKRQWRTLTLEMEGLDSIGQMGPFPSRGDYKHFFTVEGPDLGFRELTLERGLWLANLVKTSERAHRRTLQQEKDALAAKEAADRAIEHEMLMESIPAFAYQPTSGPIKTKNW
jgi:hypothetical protein